MGGSKIVNAGWWHHRSGAFYNSVCVSSEIFYNESYYFKNKNSSFKNPVPGNVLLPLRNSFVFSRVKMSMILTVWTSELISNLYYSHTQEFTFFLGPNFLFMFQYLLVYIFVESQEGKSRILMNSITLFISTLWD